MNIADVAELIGFSFFKEIDKDKTLVLFIFHCDFSVLTISMQSDIKRSCFKEALN